MPPLLRALCLAIFGFYLFFAGLILSHTKDGLDPAGSPVGYDFSAYYEAGQFALRGDAAGAYDNAKFNAIAHSRFPGARTSLPWNYPPIFQLLLLPFAALPYFLGFALWTAALLAAHAVLMRKLTGPPNFWPMLLFPGAFLNLFLGANGLLISLFIGGGIVLLKARPLLAGCLFALATFKPHLALLIPLALLCGGQFRALGAMAAATTCLAVASALLFGIDCWSAFLEKVLHVADVAESSSSNWACVPTFYTLMRVLGLSKLFAWLIQGCIALGATILTAHLWRRHETREMRMTALGLGLLLVTPYARVYDLALLAYPILGLSTAPASLIKTSLIGAAWIAPLAGLLFPSLLPWTSLVIAALMALAMIESGRTKISA